MGGFGVGVLKDMILGVTIFSVGGAKNLNGYDFSWKREGKFLLRGRFFLGAIGFSNIF